MFSPSNDNHRSQNKAQATFYGGVRRACDHCRIRKIRCNGQKPCSICYKAAKSCTYQYVPKKKGPRGAQVKTAQPQLNSPDHEGSASRHAQSPSESLTQPISPSDHHQYSDPFADLTEGTVDFFASDDSTSSTALSLAANFHDFAIASLDSFASADAPDTATMIPGQLEYSRSHGYSTETLRARIPAEVLLPLIEMFFDHLFPIMPVLDRDFYLSSDLLRHQDPMPSNEYALLRAMSAVTIVQLNLPARRVQHDFPGLTAELLVKESLHERQVSDYIENPETTVVLTSFFLFGYYGNMEKHNKARYFLHEAISFAESLDLDDEGYLSRLDNPRKAQLSRRIFWLLFITERAYALQRKNYVKIQNVTIKLPAIFESEDPRLLYGFVNLINLFLAVDTTFLSSWNGNSKSTSCSKSWLAEVLRKLDTSGVISGESLEAHDLDIAISRQWLQVLAWQIMVTHGLLTENSTEEPFSLRFPIKLARDVIKITSVASQTSLDSHGIGMEQKLADIAGCLNDVLKCADGDLSLPFRQGREYLLALLQQLSRMRGSQSRYLQPLLKKTDILTSQMFSTFALRLDAGPIDLDGYTVVEDDENGDMYAGIDTIGYLSCDGLLQHDFSGHDKTA